VTTQDAGGGESHWGTRPRRVLAFLREFVQENGYPPSMAEVGRAVGLTSTSSVAHQLQVLEDRGYIRREPGRPRAITILAQRDPRTLHCPTCTCPEDQ
jgi:repressor LexA